MNSATAYTPLECLLLFQSLVAFGTEDQDFLRISDLLTNNALVKDGATYDAQRLSSNALRELYLKLLGGELAAEEETQREDSGQSSKKRKLPTPPLPTLKDAQEYRNKLPQLVDRLYARYREYMVRAIREDEKRYATIRQEIAEIERGEWDERILQDKQAQANLNGEKNRIPAEPIRPTTNGTHKEPVPQENRTAKPHPPLAREPAKPSPVSSPLPVSSPRSEIRPEALPVNDAPNNHAINTHDARPSSPSPRLQEPPRNGFPPHPPQRSTSKGPHGPSPLQPPPLNTGQSFQWEPPYGPGLPQHHLQQPQHPQQAQHSPQPQHPQHPPYSPAQGYPPFNGSPYPPPAYPPKGAFSPSHPLQPPHGHVPSSSLNPQHPQQPILRPPQSAVLRRSPTSPGMPLDALADVAGQQYRAPSSSPLMQQGPPLPANYSPYPPQPIQQRPPSSNGPQWNQQYMQPYPGPQQQLQQVHTQQMNQQYGFAPPPMQRPQFQPPPSLMQPESRQYNSPYNVNQGTKPVQSTPAQTPRPPHPRLSNPPNEPSTPINHRLSQFITGSGTRWTPNPSGATPRSYTRLESPQVEPISPIFRPRKFPEISSEPAKEPLKKTPKKQATPRKANAAKPPKKRAPRARAGSTDSSVIAPSVSASSIVPDSRGSPDVSQHHQLGGVGSMMSPTDDTPMDIDSSRHVKEEVATPIGLGIEDPSEVTADDLPPHPRPNTNAHRQSTKRKRASSIPLERTPSSQPTHVLWTKAFTKISASALESISGHKNATMFATAVKEREAPGYKNLILRPQDLKSIRLAITAGHRAASTAATALALEDNNPSSSSVWLPISEDLIPPKGIINYSQLEKELMRMFANAIMFNADPDRGFGRKWKGKGKEGVVGYEIDEDGVVKDTRAMFADVEKIIMSLRSAERRSEGMGIGRDSSVLRGSVADDENESVAGEAEAAGGSVKRRKKA